jgi:hypothetical protein
MAIDIPRRTTTTAGGGSLDAPRPPEMSDPYAEERTFLGAIAAAVQALGGVRVSIRQPLGMGVPYLRAQGGGTMGNGEDIRLRRIAKDHSLRAVWPWGDDLPTDPSEAAKAIRRVVEPQV